MPLDFRFIERNRSIPPKDEIEKIPSVSIDSLFLCSFCSHIGSLWNCESFYTNWNFQSRTKIGNKGFWKLNYLVILISVAVLWRPHPDAKNYAYVMELSSDANDMDMETSIEGP